MSKSFVLNRSGSTPTLDNYPVSKVPVYATQADAEADISNIEDGTIIATRDGAINSSAIAQEAIDEATPEIDNLVAGSGVPAGTVVSIKSLSTLNGWLPCNGGTFDRDQYPFLYAALGNSTTLPIIIEPDEDELNKELFTGRMFMGKPVYKFMWQETTNRAANGWAVATPNGELYFPYAHDIKRIIDENSVVNNTASYQLGVSDASLFQITNTAIVDGERKVQSNSQLYTYSAYARLGSAEAPATYTIYYIKNTDVYTGAKYKYIRALSGTEATAEAAQVTNAINQLTARVAYSTMPLGNVIQMKDNSYTPTGYLLADGRDTTGTADELETNYPMLYAYLGNTNVLPTLYDHSSLPGIPDFRGTTRNNGYKGDIPLYSNITALLQAADIDVNGSGFAADGIMSFLDYNWYMVWIKDVDGSVFCLGQYSITTDQTGQVTFPVKKGQKIYAITQTGGAANTVPPAGEYTNQIYFYINIWYYRHNSYIKAVTGIEEGSTEATEVANAIGAAESAMQTQYDAFVQEVRGAGIVYNYSEEVIGTWVDGKPIYRRIIPFYRNNALVSNWTAIGSGQYTNTTDMPADVDTYTPGTKAISTRTDGWCDVYVNTGGTYGFTANKNSQKIFAVFVSTVASADIILEYTKVGD